MTVPEATPQAQEQKSSDKELNFRALENKFKAELEKERAARLELERSLQEKQRSQHIDDDDDDNEPYVDKKKLDKKLAKFGEQTQKITQTEIQKAVQAALEEERKVNWIKNNPDFNDILTHAEKIALQDPELAETILNMPNTFERQKLVYKMIKSQGLHQPAKKESTIQDKIDANRRSPYYQPSGVGAAPYSQVGDFSPTGKEQAYKKMKELQNRLKM